MALPSLCHGSGYFQVRIYTSDFWSSAKRDFLPSSSSSMISPNNPFCGYFLHRAPTLWQDINLLNTFTTGREKKATPLGFHHRPHKHLIGVVECNGAIPSQYLLQTDLRARHHSQQASAKEWFKKQTPKKWWETPKINVVGCSVDFFCEVQPVEQNLFFSFSLVLLRPFIFSMHPFRRTSFSREYVSSPNQVIFLQLQEA